MFSGGEIPSWYPNLSGMVWDLLVSMRYGADVVNYRNSLS